jgi:hypothetical protein
MEIIRFLLAQQENVITAANWADSPLAEAASLDRMDIIELLDSSGDSRPQVKLLGLYMFKVRFWWRQHCRFLCFSENRVSLNFKSETHGSQTASERLNEFLQFL